MLLCTRYSPHYKPKLDFAAGAKKNVVQVRCNDQVQCEVADGSRGMVHLAVEAELIPVGASEIATVAVAW